MVSYRKIYDTTVKKWMIGLGLTGVLLLSMFALMESRGDITILSSSGDMVCAGTIEDPCLATLTFRANLDIFVYPMEDTAWTLATEPSIKEVVMYRTWGKGLRRIPMDRPCTGTWCGLSNADDVRKFSYAFREGREYTIVFKGYKFNPEDEIKWSFGSDSLLLPHQLEQDFVDPVWFGSGNTTIESDNLVLHIPFEGDFRDISGQGNDGTQSGGLSITRGVKGRGGEFDGSDDYVQVTSTSSLESSDGLTVSVWINIGDNGVIQRIANKGNVVAGTPTVGWELYNDGNGDAVAFVVNNQSGGPAVSALISYGVCSGGCYNKWTHIVGIWNLTHAKIYVDGVLRTTSTATTQPYDYSNSVDIYVGERTGASGQNLNGSIDEVRIYNTSLTSAEIALLYNSTQTAYFVAETDPTLGLSIDNNPPDASRVGLVGEWHLDTDADDTSGEGNDGTVTGATLTGGRWGAGAYSFDGIDDGIEIPNSNDSLGFTSDFAISTWVKLDGFTSDSAVDVVNKWDSNEKNYVMRVIKSDGKVDFGVGDGGSTTLAAAGTLNALPLGSWQHLVGTYNNTDKRVSFYLNGVFQETVQHAGTFGIGNRNASIGYIGTPGPTTFNWNGTIDEVLIYNRSLSASEVADLYSKGVLVYRGTMDSKDGCNSATCLDISGYGNTGTVTNATFTNEGRFKEAYVLDGVDDFITMGDPTSLDISNNITISFWAKIRVGSVSDFIRVIWKEGAYGFYMSQSGLNTIFRIVNSTSSNTDSGTATLVKDEWVHLVGVYDQNTVEIYKNGILQAGGLPQTAPLSTSNNNLDIGKQGGSRFFNGTIDQVEIYSKALTAAQVLAKYEGEKTNYFVGMTDPTLGLTDETGLVGYWTMDSKDGSNSATAVDTSGEGNDGTVTNAIFTNEGRFKEGYEFDGADDKIDVSSVIGWNGTNDKTVSIWVNIQEASSIQIPFHYGTATIAQAFAIQTDASNNIGCSSFDGLISGVFTPYAVRVWTNVVCIYNGTHLIQYTDGEFIGSRSRAVNTGANDDLTLGESTSGSFDYEGLIDEVRIYNRSISASEVLDLYQGTKTNYLVGQEMIG